MRLRQIALVARDLEPVHENLRAVLGLGEAFRDPGVGTFGLHNVVLPVGDTFLEVVSPGEEGTSAGRLLDRRGGDGGYMVILQTEHLAVARRRMADLGVRIVWEIELEDMGTLHLHPKDVGGAILSLDVARPPESWRWAGPGWQQRARTEVALAIVGAEIQAADPAATAARWQQIVGAPAKEVGDGVREITLDAGRLRFTPLRDERGEGLAAVALRVRDKRRVLEVAARCELPVEGDAFRICGTRIDLEV